jgi:hypothetical protein
MKHKILSKISLLIISVMSMGFMSFAATAPASAVNVFPACSGNSSAVCKGTQDSLLGFWAKIINTLLFLVGSVSVVMIIVGGIRYVVSNGEQAAITGAKNTILYAIVGLVVAIMAAAIVNFVLSRL